MSKTLQKAVNELFLPEDQSIGDVKFFRGTSQSATAEQLYEQFESANRQITTGTAKRVMNIDGDPVD